MTSDICFRKAINYFLALPNQKELQQYILSHEQWLVLQDFERILQVSPYVIATLITWLTTWQIPHKVQQRMSSESLPRLGSAVPCFELFITAWEALGTSVPRVKPWTDVGLEWATKYYKRMDNTRAYVIAMRKSNDSIILAQIN
jgi:hypothetical protein